MTTTHALTGLDATTADRLRAAATAGGGSAIHIADSTPGYPCRQCLRDAEVGEELILVSHDPFPEDSASPYRSASPIFLHRTPCSTFTPTSEVPDQQRLRQLSVRAFDLTDDMRDAALIDGTDLASTLQQMFDDPVTHIVHIHNAVRGCWATTAVRTTG